MPDQTALLNNLTDEEVKALAERLKPALAQGFGVTIKRLHRIVLGKAVAFADLNFTAGTTEICTVHGFKLLRNPEDDSFWLGVPQRKAEQDGQTKWLDTFSFGNNELEKTARRVVLDEFRRQVQEEQNKF